jgi:hypothetical protein
MRKKVFWFALVVRMLTHPITFLVIGFITYGTFMSLVAKTDHLD